MRYHEIIGEDERRTLERQAHARREISAAQSKRANAGRRYQDALRSADERLKAAQQSAGAVQSQKQQAARRYQDAVKSASERAARASRSLTQQP